MSERLSTGHVNALMATFKTTYANGIMAIYTGAQPATADAAETGTLLALVTEGGGAFVGGAATNGINFGDPVAGVCDRAVAEEWKGAILATGTAGYFRFYDNTFTTGISTTAKRFDGAISTSTAAEITMNTTILTLGGPDVTVDTLPVTMPKA